MSDLVAGRASLAASRASRRAAGSLTGDVPGRRSGLGEGDPVQRGSRDEFAAFFARPDTSRWRVQRLPDDEQICAS